MYKMHLKAMRAYTNLTQSQVAEAVDLNVRTIMNAESGNAMSKKTWGILTDFYKANGISLIDAPPGYFTLHIDKDKIKNGSYPAEL